MRRRPHRCDMVQVRYNPDVPSLRVSGHAGAGKYGEDLVCAAVSILAHTLGEWVPGRIFAGEAMFGGGQKEVYEILWKGFLVLESLYPEYVRCIKMTKTDEGGRNGKDDAADVR